MLDNDDKNIIREIIKEENTDLRSDVKNLKEDVKTLKEDVKNLKEDVKTLKEDVKTLKEDVVSLKTDVRKLGILMESMNDKVDLILENLVGNNEKLKDLDKLKETVYQNHEMRIKALEASPKK